MSEWNRGRPDNYTYNDATFTKWCYRMFGYLDILVSPGSDRCLACPECDRIVMVFEETRRANHDITNLRRMAKQLDAVGFLVILDNMAPACLGLLWPSTWAPDIRAVWEREAAGGNLVPRMSSGQRAARDKILLTLLHHMLSHHGVTPWARSIAEYIGTEIADLPEIRSARDA